MVDFHEDIFIQVYHVPCIYLPTSDLSPNSFPSLVPFFSTMILFIFAQTHLRGGRKDMRHLSF